MKRSNIMSANATWLTDCRYAQNGWEGYSVTFQLEGQCHRQWCPLTCTLPMGREGQRGALRVYSAHLVWECAHPDCGGWCRWQPHTCKPQSHSAGGDAGRAKCCSLFPLLLAFHCPIYDAQETQIFRHTKTQLHQLSCCVTMERRGVQRLLSIWFIITAFLLHSIS